MNIKLKGMYGSMQRMRELQSRIESMTPQKRTRSINKLDDVLPMPKSEISTTSLDRGNFPLDPTNLPRHLQRAPNGLMSLIQSAAEKHGIDPALFESLIYHESSFNPNAVSRAGAKGLAQLMQPTADMLDVANIFDPEQNLNAGARYLSQMIKKHENDVELALGAYNAGPRTVAEVGGVPRESRKYVDDVLEMANLIRISERTGAKS